MLSSRFLLLCIFVGAAQANEQDDGSQSPLRKRLFDPLSANQADPVRRVKGQRSATTGLGRSLQVTGPSVTTFAVTNAMLNGADSTGVQSVMSLQVTALPTPEPGAAPESSTKSITEAPTWEAPTTSPETSTEAPTWEAPTTSPETSTEAPIGAESFMSLQVTALPTPELGSAPEIESSTKAPTILLESSTGAPTTSPIRSMPTPEIAAITTTATLNSQVSSPTPSPAPGPKGKKGKFDTTPVTMTMPGVSAVVAATSAGGAQAKKGKKRARK